MKKYVSRLLSIFLVASAFQIINAPTSRAAVSTLNLASTTAKPQVDPNFQVGTSLSATSWASAYGSDHPWGTTSISGGATSSTWIACDTSDGTTCVNTTRYFRYRFSMPSDYTSPSLTIKWLVDNYGSIYLNGTQIPGSTNSGGGNAVVTATRTTGFQAGVNTLVFEVIDAGGLAGFGFAMQISATTNGAITGYAASAKVPADLSFATTSYSKNFGQTQAVLATSSSSGAITYSAGSSTACSVNSSNGLVTISAGTGTCVISASVAADANYLATSSTNSVTITVSRAPQSAITITPETATLGSNLTLTSTGGSTGGTYNYSKVSGNCTLSGAVLTPTAAGSCVVQSNLTANANFLAETSTATTIPITDSRLTTPAAPIVSATSNALKSITVSWTAITNASSYTLRLYSSIGTLITTTDLTGRTGTSATITASNFASLADSTAYKVSITAIGNGTTYLDSEESAKSDVTTNSPPGSPTISVQPVARTSIVNSTTTFSVTATSPDSGALGYQWQVNTGSSWENVSTGSGGTTSTYTTATLAITASGYQYRVNITNTKNGAISTALISNAVALTVNAISQGAAITLDPGTLVYRQAKELRATVSIAGRVTFKVNNKVIPGCIKKAVAAGGTATCSYRPAIKGSITITAIFDPTDSAYSGVTTSSNNVVAGRTGRRGG